MRIVSLLPSATEMICALGLRDQLVGVTHECDYPESVTELPKLTETLIPVDATSQEIDRLVRERLEADNALYRLNRPILEELAPDLIVTQALCDVCAVAEAEVQEAACSLPGTPRVLNLEPITLEEVFKALRQVGDAAGCSTRAEAVVASLRTRVRQVESRSQHLTTRPRVMLLEWVDPPFSAGHWNPELVQLAGGEEVIGIAGEASRRIEWEEVLAVDPEVMIVSCCGYDRARTTLDLPILQSYPYWNELSCVKQQRVYVVDGSAYFSRPGPRLVDSLELLAHTLHPDVHPLPDHLTPASPVV